MAAVQAARSATLFGHVRSPSARCQAAPCTHSFLLLSARAPAQRTSLFPKPLKPSLKPCKQTLISRTALRASVGVSVPIGTEKGGDAAIDALPAPILPPPIPANPLGDPPASRPSAVPDPPPSGVLSARQVYVAAAKSAVLKSKLSNTRILLQAVVAGVFISLGAALFLQVGGACPTMQANDPGLHAYFRGLIGLPFGLTLTVFTGMELFTGNTFVMTAGWLDGRIPAKEVLRNWLFSYAGNFLGSLLAVWAFNIAQILPHAASQATSIGLSVAKTSYPLGTLLMKGILCNWMVCMAVWISYASTDGVSKYVAMFVTISSFVALGFEHSVANMFIIPYGMLLGANVSWKEYLLGNLLPVSIGNVIGGAFCVATVLGYFYSENLNRLKESTEGLKQ